MKKALGLALALLSASVSSSHAGPAPSRVEWSDSTTATAAAYCLAKHPYVTAYSGTYTPDGYEIARPHGVVGAVRRNFVYKRSTLSVDEGAGQTCEKACYQFGLAGFNSPNVGHALHQTVGGKVFASGIGDMAALAFTDRDFYLSTDVTAGIWSRANTWQESDVAQADLCCCQVTNP